jgi:hypothetical protein
MPQLRYQLLSFSEATNLFADRDFSNDFIYVILYLLPIDNVIVIPLDFEQ